MSVAPRRIGFFHAAVDDDLQTRYWLYRRMKEVLVDINTNTKVDVWLIMTGYHRTDPGAEEEHFTVRAFREDGRAFLTLHVYENKRPTVFKNGGDVFWKSEFGRELKWWEVDLWQ
ncbi:hypothetical protein CC1G_12874 [Coprinopsis cinerea okayama7|uniref:Uncharacterized protein n=1 Tax=Coprinopsis cinerea (strain Okayama-7 / 130 / ATCC MYA-4618 / FGSC 9003) TaxID=240176 RepID=D6RR11_COPC7|nr:hypothetical protein CC1G_12874 [Coprinopsis cinerea okayama7\|eukprot:XP_002910088.1 hypothetical protein CC1G_12874 [Coprinopsis cinerea okayama7\